MESSGALTLNGGRDHYPGQFQQNVVVMRHGDRIDNVEPLWLSTASRPWDPPLADEGKLRAFSTGKKLRTDLGFPIHRVFVSPFLRCVQTASEVISALCAVEDSPEQLRSDNISIDPSKLKVSIEYGLCEILNRIAIRAEPVPKDGNWGFKISELEAILPAGTVDHSPELVYQELPQWEEPVNDARVRYEQVIRTLADKFPSENLLFVTHGEGVGVSVSASVKDITVYRVEYCAYSHSQRSISFNPSHAYTAGNFELVSENGQNGICYYPTGTLVDA